MRHLPFLLAGFVGLAVLPALAQTEKPPVPIAVVGLVHVHVHGYLPQALKNPAVKVVGIVEPNADLVAKAAETYELGPEMFFPTTDALLAKHPEVKAVAAFTSTLDHRKVVEAVAPRGIAVMMEKPLAVNMTDARAMAEAAEKGKAQLFVNYETTWYAGNQAAYTMVHDEKAIGEIRKIVVHSGHQGPQEIGCPPEFLAWLTDPIQNGGGAIADFGCYGADLITWLMDGQRPTSVFAVTQQLKPLLYPKVDDEATIVLTYPKSQAIIQASWNWPYDRKDLEIYGEGGYVIVPRSSALRVMLAGKSERPTTLKPLTGPESNPVSYLAGVVRGEIKPSGLSSLPVNLTVVEILDAAKESAATGRKIELPTERK